jgi:hypothetical protein
VFILGVIPVLGDLGCMPFDSIDVGDESPPPLGVTLSGAQVKSYAVAANMPGGRFMSDGRRAPRGCRGRSCRAT